MLVTGGCGFIGANFVKYILEESDFTGNIINVDTLTYAGNPENLKSIAKTFSDRYFFIKADIYDKERMAKIFDEYEIDSICHFAAESHVDRSISSPDAFMKTNIMGTYNLLEVARNRLNRIILFHHVSTDEVYGSLGATGYFTETSFYRPNSPYAASKASSDHIVRSYFKTFNLPVTISNCSNNYGPYQYPEKLLPLIILNAIEGKPLPVYGDGKNVRDWLYVKDHCSAVWTIMKNFKPGETHNIGGNNEMQNIDIVKLICDIIDADDKFEKLPNSKSRRELITFVKDRPGHDQRYAIDSTKLKEDFGWTPKESLESGLRKTLRWYVNNSEWVNRTRTGEYQSWIKKQYGPQP